MRIRLSTFILGPVVLVTALAPSALADGKSHKEMWSDPAAMTASTGSRAEAAPSALRGAGPMLAELGHSLGARTLAQVGSDTSGTTATGAAAAGAAAASEAERQGEKLTDEKILHVAHVANAGEIDQAKLATSKAVDPRVRQFAKMMITMHTEADKKEADVVRRRSLTMVASKTSDGLMSSGKTTMDMLRSKSGAAFDHAYMDAQVKNHEDVLKLIDTRLQPDANDKDVKSLVSSLRPTVQSHLDQAKSLQSRLKD